MNDRHYACKNNICYVSFCVRYVNIIMMNLDWIKKHKCFKKNTKFRFKCVDVCFCAIDIPSSFTSIHRGVNK